MGEHLAVVIDDALRAGVGVGSIVRFFLRILARALAANLVCIRAERGDYYSNTTYEKERHIVASSQTEANAYRAVDELHY